MLTALNGTHTLEAQHTPNGGGSIGGGGGAVDSTELSVGISEALVNTASGIATAAFALMGYNYYTNKIDKLTFSLDEVGFTIVQTFSATH